MSQTEEQSTPRKSDVPFWLSGRIVVAACSVCVVSSVIVIAFAPAYRFGRPGLLDGLFGLVLGFWLGDKATNLIIEALRSRYISPESSLLGLGRRRFSPLDRCMSGALVACVLIGWLLRSWLGLGMPWTSEFCGAWTVFLFVLFVLFARRYGEWYDSLPD